MCRKLNSTMFRPRTVISCIQVANFAFNSPSRLSLLKLRDLNYCLWSFTLRNMSSSSKPKVFVTRRVPEEGITLLKQHFEVTQWNSDDAIPRERLKEGIKGVDALFCLLTDKIDEEILDTAGDY